MLGVGADYFVELIDQRSNSPCRFNRSWGYDRNGIWVDSGYSSGYPLTNVARGTEQYRALVADEPGLGTIANQLEGEILVVWKGRAYRIR